MAGAAVSESLIGLGCGILGCYVFKPGGTDRLDAYGTGGTCSFDAFSAQAMVYGWDHPCRHENCDKLHKDGGKVLIAIVFAFALAEAKALVDDPAAFTREMTRILREKQSHPLIGQMMKPAESSDPPPAKAASSSTGGRDKPCTSQSVQFQ